MRFQRGLLPRRVARFGADTVGRLIQSAPYCWTCRASGVWWRSTQSAPATPELLNTLTSRFMTSPCSFGTR